MIQRSDRLDIITFWLACAIGIAGFIAIAYYKTPRMSPETAAAGATAILLYSVGRYCGWKDGRKGMPLL